MMTTRDTLSWQTILLHWVVGLSFIGVFGLGLYMVDQPAPGKFELYGIHKSIGFLILIAAVARIFWRLKEGALPALSTSSALLEKLAKAIHGLLMLATLAMPISGVAMSIGGGRAVSIFAWEIIPEGEEIPWLGEAASAVHHMAVELIILVLVLHVAGAIKHQLVDKDGTLSRMLGR
jgi:cytochrome b561